MVWHFSIFPIPWKSLQKNRFSSFNKLLIFLSSTIIVVYHRLFSKVFSFYAIQAAYSLYRKYYSWILLRWPGPCPSSIFKRHRFKSGLCGFKIISYRPPTMNLEGYNSKYYSNIQIVLIKLYNVNHYGG